VKPDGTAKKDGLEKTFSKSYQLQFPDYSLDIKQLNKAWKRVDHLWS